MKINNTIIVWIKNVKEIELAAAERNQKRLFDFGLEKL
jgi:hypothetical protein